MKKVSFSMYSHGHRRSPVLVRSLAGLVAFAVFITPIEIPLEDVLDPTDDATAAPTGQPSAYEEYSLRTDDGQLASTVTYKKGESKPTYTIAVATANSIEHVALATLTDTGSASPSLIEESVAPSSRAKTHARSKRSTHPNIIAAEQIASGESGSEIAEVTLDDNANIIAVVDEHGATTAAEYDEAGRPLKITKPDGTVAYYAYDELGNLTGISHTEVEQIVERDLIDAVVHAVTTPLRAFADSSELNIGFQYQGSRITDINSKEDETSYVYDADGLLIEEIRGDGSSVDFGYDELGNVIEKTESPAEESILETLSLRSFFRHSLAEVTPPTYTETAEYNDDNRLARYSIFKDVVIEETIEDGTGTSTNIKATTTPAIESENAHTETVPEQLSPEPVTETETVTPEAAPAPENTESTESVTESILESTPETSPIPAEDPESPVEPVSPEEVSVPDETSPIEETIAWARTLVGSIQTKIASYLTFTFAEDALPSEDGELVTPEILESQTTPSVVAPDSVATTTIPPDSVASEADTEVVEEAPRTDPLFDTNFSYDPHGNVLESTSLSGVTLSYRYSDATNALNKKVVTTKLGTPFDLTYTTNESARVIAYNGQSFLYNDAAMLRRAGDETYTHDERGNRTRRTDARDNTQYVYDENRLTEVHYPQSRSTVYEYDAKGAVTEVNDSVRGTTKLSYTLNGAVESISHGDEKIAYTYDGLGQRTSRVSTSDGERYYAYTGSRLKQVTDENDIILSEYFYTPKGELTATIVDGVLYQTVTDRSKSVIGLIRNDTHEVLSQSYGIWGDVTASTFPKHFVLGYAGAFHEPTRNFSILGPRVYDPEIGRFLSKDPLPGIIIDTLSQNEYIYAKNDPVNQYDPSGHASELSEESTSPKRALVEIMQIKDEIANSLRDAERDLVEAEADLREYPEDEAVLLSRQGAQEAVDSLIATLKVIQQMQDDQEREIAENEAAALAAAQLAVPVALDAPIDVSSSNALDALQSSLTELNLNTPPVTTPEAPPVTEPVLPEAESIPPSEPIDDEDDDSVSFGLPVLNSLAFLGVPVLAVLSFADDHLLKAEAKKKKSSKKKKKDKKKKKKAKKKAVSKAAKAKQEAKAKKSAELTARIQYLEKLLVILQKFKVIKDEVNKKLAAEAAAIRALAEEKAKAIAVAPSVPAIIVADPTSSLPAAGITAPQTTVTPGFSDKLKALFSKNNIGTVLSLIPIVGEFYDATSLLMQADPMTGERLTPLTSAITAIGLISGYGSGNLARRVFSDSVKKMAADLNIPEEEVIKIAEKAIKEVDLEKISVQSFADFTKKVREKAEEFKAKPKVSMSLATLLRADMPQHARKALEDLEQSGWNRNWLDQANNEKWLNRDNQLPAGATYTEWDVVEGLTGPNRGLERFVKSSNGDVYYTNTHYGKEYQDTLPAFYLIK